MIDNSIEIKYIESKKNSTNNNINKEELLRMLSEEMKIKENRVNEINLILEMFEYNRNKYNNDYLNKLLITLSALVSNDLSNNSIVNFNKLIYNNIRIFSESIEPELLKNIKMVNYYKNLLKLKLEKLKIKYYLTNELNLEKKILELSPDSDNRNILDNDINNDLNINENILTYREFEDNFNYAPINIDTKPKKIMKNKKYKEEIKLTPKYSKQGSGNNNDDCKKITLNIPNDSDNDKLMDAYNKKNKVNNDLKITNCKLYLKNKKSNLIFNPITAEKNPPEKCGYDEVKYEITDDSIIFKKKDNDKITISITNITSINDNLSNNLKLKSKNNYTLFNIIYNVGIKNKNKLEFVTTNKKIIAYLKSKTDIS